jgi:hypothetical protein
MMRSKVVPFFLLASAIGGAFTFGMYKNRRYELAEVCYRPGPLSCTQVSLGPPQEFSEVKFVPIADALFLGAVPFRFRMGVHYQGGVIVLRERFTFYGWQRRKSSKEFGDVRIRWSEGQSGPILDVFVGSENRTYYLKMRRIN